MRILGKKWLALTAVIPVAALIACSSDAPVQVMTPRGEIIDEDEYNELVEAGLIDEMGNRIEEPEDVETGSDESSSSKDSGDKTSSASKDESSSADKDDSSSSGTGDTAKSSSSAAGNASSSSVAASSSSAKASSSSVAASSSSAKASSSSVAASSSSVKASSSSVAASSSSVAPSSSSVDQASSSSVAPATSSSAAAQVTECSDADGECTIGSNVMDAVDPETKTELDSLKELVDNGETTTGFEELPEGLTGETFNYNFLGENDVYCFTGEGEWLHVVREELGKYINHFKNGAAWGQLEKFEIIFAEECAEVYFRPKN